MIFVRTIVLMSMMFFSTLAISAIQNTDINLEGLSDAQKAELIASAESMRAYVEKNESMTDPAFWKEWAELGQGMGIALAKMAGELGVAADQILNSTTGKIAMGLIIVKVLDINFLGIPFGIAWFTFMIPLFFWVFKKTCSDVVTIDKRVGKEIVEMRVLKFEPSDNETGYFTVAFILIIIIGLLAIFA